MSNYPERQRLRELTQRAASVAVYIAQCDDALRAAFERTNGQWPDSLTVPMWSGQTERRALVRWIDEIRAKSGKTIQIAFEPPLFRQHAQKRGQHVGRPPKLTPQQQEEARQRWAEGVTIKELAQTYKVGRSTISRLAHAPTGDED